MDAVDIPAKAHQTLLVKILPEHMRDRFVDILLSISDSKPVSPGEVLFRLGERNVDRGCFMLDGALKVTRADGEVRYSEAPAILGEVQLFSPNAERTATVEVVYGGPALNFKWQELGARAQEEFSQEELAELRDAIKHLAGMREQNLLRSLEERTGS